jgi:Alpha-2-macroglobulin family/MG2 domain
MFCFPKQLLLLVFSFFFTLCLSAQNDHATTWKEIDSLLDNYEPIKASQKLDQLFIQVQKDKKDDQWVKCLVYQLAFLPQNSDQNLSKSIAKIKQSIDKAPTAQSKALLKVLLAKKYLQIYQENYDRIYGRDDKPNKDMRQIQTWTRNDFEKTVFSLYKSALLDSTLLKATPINKYGSLFDKVSAKTNDNLYTVILNEIVSETSLSSHDVSENSLVGDRLLLPLEDFLNIPIGNTGLWSNFILKCYQQLMLSQKHQLSSLITLDIDRLSKGASFSTLANAQALYTKRLEYWVNKYPGNPGCIKAYEFLAKEYLQSDNGIKHSYKESMIYLKQIEKILSPDVFKKSNFSRLEKSILKKELDYPQVESINYPGKPFRAYIEFRNIDTLYIRIIKASPFEKSRRLEQEHYFEKACQAIPVRSESIAMPFSNDYTKHRTEFKIDALEQSGYILLVSSSAAFNYKVDLMHAIYFVVSPFMYYQKDSTLFLRDLNSGQSIAGAQVSLNGKDGSLILGETNPEGEVDFSKIKSFNFENSFLKIIKGADSLVDVYNRLGYGKNRSAKLTLKEPLKVQKMLFYTDKASYQQGQLIQFKGLVLDQFKDMPQETLFTEKKRFKVYLKEAKGKKVDSILLETNELGSLSGSFQIPKNLKLGEYTISGDVAESACSWFKIANYQLYVNNFAASGLSINLTGYKSCYNINDTVLVKGQLTGTAGNFVAGAKISFSVDQQEILGGDRFLTEKGWLKGNTITDATGEFQISFPASTIDPKFSDPKFSLYFRVHIVAETQDRKFKSTEFSVYASNQYLKVKVQVPEIIELAQLKNELNCQVSEAYGDKIVNVPVLQHWYKVQTENRLLRKRQWNKPDLHLYSKEMYINYFPHDEYDEETDITTLKTVPIQGQPKEPGLYKICINVNDSLNQQASDSAFVYLYNPMKVDDPYLFGKTHVFNQNQVSSDSIQWRSFDANQSLFMQRTWIRGNQSFPDSYIRSNQDQGISQEKITQSDRGGIIIRDGYIWQGRFYEKKTKFTTRFDLDPLKILYKTYRQKNFIGSKETWTVAMENPNLDPASMELMSVLYDANLDADRSSLGWEWTNNKGPFDHIVTFYNFQYDRPEIPMSAYYEYRHKHQEEERVDSDDEQEKDNESFKIPSFNESLTNILYKTDTYVKPDRSGAGPGKYFSPQEPRIEDTETKSVIRLSNESKLPTELKETVFFFPQLRADKNGLFQMQFEFPNISTKWNWKTMVHSKELFFGFKNQVVNTQKQLFVEPDFPTKLVAGKLIMLPATITNLTATELQGSVTLELFDAITKQKIEGLIDKTLTNQQFIAKPGMPIKLQFGIQLPVGFNKKMTWKIMATAGNFSDGEENDFQVNK